MNLFDFSRAVSGWFVGPFHPSAYYTDQCEVAVKKYARGVKERAHFHKIATEITLIYSGAAKINGNLYHEGQIVTLRPGESAAFEAVEETVTVVVKTPAAKDDKFFL